MAYKNVDQHEKDIERITKDAINSITVSDWKQEVNRVERLQKEYWEKDGLTDDFVRELVINLGGEETSDSSSESDKLQSIVYSDDD